MFFGCNLPITCMPYHQSQPLPQCITVTLTASSLSSDSVHLCIFLSYVSSPHLIISHQDPCAYLNTPGSELASCHSLTCSWLHITSGCTLLTLHHWGFPGTTSYWVSVGLWTLKSVANSPQALSVCYSRGLFPTFLCCMIDLSPAVSHWVPVVGEALIRLISWCVTSPKFSILTLLINWMLTLLD